MQTIRLLRKILFETKTPEKIIAEVGEKKAALRSGFDNMDYWQLIEELCYDLSLLILDLQKAKDDRHWKDLEKRYKRIWRSSGSKGKRMAEIENFEIISDALNLSTSRHALYLKERIDVLWKVHG